LVGLSIAERAQIAQALRGWTNETDLGSALRNENPRFAAFERLQAKLDLDEGKTRDWLRVV